eukprot:364680-Chlamydomonas_euryale.AAC.8
MRSWPGLGSPTARGERCAGGMLSAVCGSACCCLGLGFRVSGLRVSGVKVHAVWVCAQSA